MGGHHHQRENASFDELIELLETHAGRDVWPDALPLFREAFLEAPHGFERELHDAIFDPYTRKPIGALRTRVNRGYHRRLSSSSPKARRSRRASRPRSEGPSRLEVVVRPVDDCVGCGRRTELVDDAALYCASCAAEKAA